MPSDRFSASKWKDSPSEGDRLEEAVSLPGAYALALAAGGKDHSLLC
ncbi:MAG: hypothetical protein LBQ54_09280 [Planctomycetaceae bacterium]|nr:hypothetical protein [Planctomycetaceae bacterium]